MELRSKVVSSLRRLPSPQDGLRAVVQRAPQAEAMAASWIESVRPLAVQLYALRPRIATITGTRLAGFLFFPAMFGRNSLVVYKNNRAEDESLAKRITREQ